MTDHAQLVQHGIVVMFAGVHAMNKLADFGRVMSLDYAIPILRLLNDSPTYRVGITRKLGIKGKKATSRAEYYIFKLRKVGLIEKERSIHTNEVLNYGKYRLTPLGEKAFKMAVRVAEEINLPKNKLLLTSKGKVRLLK